MRHTDALHLYENVFTWADYAARGLFLLGVALLAIAIGGELAEVAFLPRVTETWFLAAVAVFAIALGLFVTAAWAEWRAIKKM